MTVFATGYDFMTTAQNESGATSLWQNPQNVLQDPANCTKNIASNGSISKLETAIPKAGLLVPGGFPLLPGVVLVGIDLSVRMRRSNTGQSFEVDHLIGGANSYLHMMLADSDTAYRTFTVERDLSEWGLTQQEAVDFITGTTKLYTDVFRGPNGGTTLNIQWIKAQVRYDYTPTGNSIPRLF